MFHTSILSVASKQMRARTHSHAHKLSVCLSVWLCLSLKPQHTHTHARNASCVRVVRCACVYVFLFSTFPKKGVVLSVLQKCGHCNTLSPFLSWGNGACERDVVFVQLSSSLAGCTTGADEDSARSGRPAFVRAGRR